jgi:hypothetical protein
VEGDPECLLSSNGDPPIEVMLEWLSIEEIDAAA